MKNIKVEKFNIHIEEKENYIQINDVQEVEEVMSLIKEKYKGYQIDFCYHNNMPPKNALESIGATLLDNSLEMRLEARSYLISQSYDGIVQVTKENFELFAKFHDTKNSSMYWNSKRILESLNDWSIFMILDKGDIVGYVLTAMWNIDEAEVYSLVAPNIILGRNLLFKTIQNAFNRNHKEILFMADKNSLDHLCALEVGFSETGFYQSYRTFL